MQDFFVSNLLLRIIFFVNKVYVIGRIRIRPIFENEQKNCGCILIRIQDTTLGGTHDGFEARAYHGTFYRA